ncbi:hypothetical protein FEDK69T_26590 [Flavobacterium enshiense DK69]|nr:hypothetical protein FEDK69T_26590 [Flavobacterium enshiense DK69]
MQSSHLFNILSSFNLFLIEKEKKQNSFAVSISFIHLHPKPEEKFELIATSIKNAKAVPTTPLGNPCNYFSSLKFKNN